MRRVIVMLGLAGLAACGDGGGSSNLAPPPPNVSPGGLWTAQWIEASGPTAGDSMSLKALVTEAGDFFYAGYDATNGCAVVGFGQLAVSGSAVSGTTQNAVVAYSAAGANTGCAYPDGTTYGTGSVAGTISERSAANLTVASQTALGLALPVETHAWTYNGLYALPSSLATIAANYVDGANTLTISANGAVYEQDPATGCVINGTVSILDASYNAYGIRLTFSNCTGQSVLLNGLTATGLGYFDNTVSPNQLLIGLKLTIGGQTAVIIGGLQKM